jgi:Fe-S-cluster containining protein
MVANGIGAEVKKDVREIRLEILRPDLMPPGRVPRDEILPDDSICNNCTGKCCRYFTVPLRTPRTAFDFDELRWFLAHGQTLIFTETEEKNGRNRTKWNLVVWTQCQYLLPDNGCMIYDTRPQVCRDYSTEGCEYDTPWSFEQSFDSPDAIEAYGREYLASAREARRRKRSKTV